MYKLLESPNSLWKKLFMMFYKIELTEEFINCADNQLTLLFEQLTGIKTIWPIRLSWSSERELGYEKGIVSKISAQLSLKYGFNQVAIKWKSNSGRIYLLHDTDIDCNDIKFWFEGLDPALCQHYWKPKWTLITFKDNYIEALKKKSDLHFQQVLWLVWINNFQHYLPNLQA